MSDMTAMEKAREALIDVMRFLNARVEKTSGEIYHIDQLREALAALEAEKPAEDAGECAELCIAVWLSPSTDRRNDTAKLIHSFAESYHAKRCAECKKRRQPYRPFGTEPLPEDRP